MKGILQCSSVLQVQCTDNQFSAQCVLNRTADTPTLCLQCNGFRFGSRHLYFRYNTLKYHFDFVATEQLVLENVETDTGISNVHVALL